MMYILGTVEGAQGTNEGNQKCNVVNHAICVTKGSKEGSSVATSVAGIWQWLEASLFP